MVALGVVALDPPGNGGHRGYGLHRKVADRTLIREHHRICAVEDGIGHIAHFGPGGPGATHHRIEHLGGGDNRDTEAVGLADQLLLQQGHFLGRHFDAEVAPCHHHPVTEGQDVVDLVDRLKFLDLCHYWGLVAVAADQLADLDHVGGIAHEAEGHPVDPLLQTKGEIGPILVGESSDRKLHIGEVDPLVVGEHPADGDAAVEGLLALVDLFNQHLHPAVIEQDAAAGHHFIGQFGVGDACHRHVAGHIPRGEFEAISLGQSYGSISKAAQADFGPLKILKNADLDTQLGCDLADGGDANRMVAVVAVGKIETKCSGASGYQLPQPLWGFRGGPDGGHDLGASHEIGLGHAGANRQLETTIQACNGLP